MCNDIIFVKYIENTDTIRQVQSAKIILVHPKWKLIWCHLLVPFSNIAIVPKDFFSAPFKVIFFALFFIALSPVDVVMFGE